MLKKFSIAGYWFFLLASMTLLVTPAMAFEREGDAQNPFGLSYADLITPESDGKSLVTDFYLSIPPQHYIYKESLQVELDNPTLKAELKFPPAEKKFDDFKKGETLVYHNQLLLTLTIRGDAEEIARNNITGTLTYQGCSGNLCNRPVHEKFTIIPNLPITSAASIQNQSVDTKEKIQNGSWLDFLHTKNIQNVYQNHPVFAVLIFFLAGFGTGFTPCVLPVIPLTLAFMGLSQKAHRKTKIRSLIGFLIGMVFVSSTLGILSAVLGKTLGFWLQSTFLQALLTIFFLIMGLAMWDLVPLRLPAKWQNRLAGTQPEGPLRSFYAGLTVGFLAAPCVGPVVGPLLATLSLSGNILRGAFYMSTYALGLSTMFVILAFASWSLTSKLSGVGRLFKGALGLLLIGTSLFYGSVLAAPLFNKQQDTLFLHTLDDGLTTAKRTKKPILVDFYADWCLPCQAWDKFLRTKRIHQKLMAKAVLVKIDCTREDAICQQAVDQYQVVGFPTILFLNANGKEKPGTRLVGQTPDEDAFMKILDDASSYP